MDFTDALEQFRNYICYYFNKRGLVWPNFDDAMKFLLTEIAETYELDLARDTWVRNNPESKPEFDKERLSEELGDIIMMAIVAGIAEDVNPLLSLYNKTQKKLKALEVENV